MSSMHSVNQCENKKAPALIGSDTSVPELDIATSGHVRRSGSSCSNQPTHRSLSPLAASTVETTIAAEAAAVTNGAISAPNGSRPTARALVGQRACAARRRDATDGPDGRVASEAWTLQLVQGYRYLIHEMYSPTSYSSATDSSPGAYAYAAGGSGAAGTWSPVVQCNPAPPGPILSASPRRQEGPRAWR